MKAVRYNRRCNAPLEHRTSKEESKARATHEAGSFLSLFLFFVSMMMAPLVVLAVGDRSGGDSEVIYESVNGGGTSFATNAADTIKLGGTLGQGGMYAVVTNGDDECQSGFWKAEDACTLYAPSIIGVAYTGGQMGITFMVVNSNQYEVLYVKEADGGMMEGLHAFTNSAASLVGQGLAGASTTVWDTVSSEEGCFYLIRCRP